MANPNPDTSGLKPGHQRQKGPGDSTRLSAYLTPEQQARLAAHMIREQRTTPNKASREHARLLELAQDLLAVSRGEPPVSTEALDLIRQAAAQLDAE